VSNVVGSFNVSLGFSDSTAQPTKSVLKTLSLLEESEGLTGKIAIVSGTVGTAAVVTPAYRNASGAIVSFPDRGDSRGGINRIVLQSQSPGYVTLACGDFKLLSGSGEVAETETPGESAIDSFSVTASSGTADYLVIVYADGD